MTDSLSRGNAVHFRAVGRAVLRAGSEVIIVRAAGIGETGVDGGGGDAACCDVARVDFCASAAAEPVDYGVVIAVSYCAGDWVL